MLLNTGDKPIASQNNLLTTVAWQIDGKITYALEGSIFIAGAVVQWLRDGLGIISTPPRSSRWRPPCRTMAASICVPAFAGLGAPHWDQYARGTISGMTRGTTAGHIARAALEGIAFQTADVLEAMQADSGIPLKELRVDGGATATTICSCNSRPTFSACRWCGPRIRETTALGAAYLAGLATGFWQSTEELQKQWQRDKEFCPSMNAAKAAELKRHWHKAVERAKGWLKD